MPTVIAVLNQKGGTGKTTTATNVASCLVSVYGASVLLVDLDPQGSASDWSAARGEEPGPGQVPVVRMGRALARDLPRVAHSYDYVVIDGTPQISELATAAVKSADVVIIPVQPSPYDIWACEELVDLIKDRQELTDGAQPRAAMVVSRAIKGTRLEGEVWEALEGYGLPVFKTGTCQRQAYANTVKTGGSVIDLPANDKARQEIEALTAELLEFAK